VRRSRTGSDICPGDTGGAGTDETGSLSAARSASTARCGRRAPPEWSPADLRRSDAHRGLLREVVLAVRPRWLMHGHLHLSYQRQVDLGRGPIEVTGLDCDGAESGNWAIVDITSMRWLRFQGRPISNALRSLVSR